MPPPRIPDHISERISERISWLRLPLILGVIVAHAGNDLLAWPITPGWAAFLIQLISGVWARNNVSLLYAISGYLFFFSFSLTWADYQRRLSRRLRSLVVPYLVWNVANLLFLATIQALPFTGVFFSGNRTPIADYTLWDTLDAFLGLSGAPLVYPFWFIRDLILMVVVAPVFYLFAKRVPWLAAAALYLYWFLSPDTVVLLTPRSLLFFYLGALLSVQQPDLHKLDRWRWWIFAAYGLASIADAAFVPQSLFLHHAAMTLGVAALWVFAAWLGRSTRLTQILDAWAPGAFFLFAMHEPLLTILRKLGVFLFPPANGWQILALYILLILLTTAGGMAAWKLSCRLSPALTRLVSGGR